MTTDRTLVAGVGNIFLGDDGFGVEVVRRLAARPASDRVCVVDFGIRGLDLTYALLEYERVILVDAAPRGRAPGTLYVLEPQIEELAEASGRDEVGHGLAPQHALAMARALGAPLRFVRVVGCEPAAIPEGDELAAGLSPAVEDAVDGAVAIVEELLEAIHA